jgi:hypothetical protein
MSHPAAISCKGREGFFIILRALGALCVENSFIYRYPMSPSGGRFTQRPRRKSCEGRKGSPKNSLCASRSLRGKWKIPTFTP